MTVVLTGLAVPAPGAVVGSTVPAPLNLTSLRASVWEYAFAPVVMMVPTGLIVASTLAFTPIE